MAWMAAGRTPGKATIGRGIMADPSGPVPMLVGVQLRAEVGGYARRPSTSFGGVAAVYRRDMSAFLRRFDEWPR
ncbi:hypothetical protein PG2089B_1158 [Bifidobacterium pseudolongum subsp. globosum]|nr:hypothetical protein PG2089B_1158 [Bifidobacterium pseudolongum subsp. globosum]